MYEEEEFPQGVPLLFFAPFGLRIVDGGNFDTRCSENSNFLTLLVKHKESLLISGLIIYVYSLF
jgi:hypothetical protein